MNALFKSNIQSELQTEILADYGVNAARVSELSELLASFSVANTFSNKTNPTYKLPSFLFGFVLFLTAAAKAVAVLFKIVLKLISVILEIAPRGILFLLSLVNVVIFRYSLSRAEWLMKVNDEDNNSLFWTNDSDSLPLYVQQNFNLYEL